MMKKNNVANHERHELHHNELTTKTKNCFAMILGYQSANST